MGERAALMPVRHSGKNGELSYFISIDTMWICQLHPLLFQHGPYLSLSGPGSQTGA